MKLKVVIVDLELSPRTKRWGLRAFASLGVLLGSALAYAGLDGGTGGLIVWSDGQTLKAADLNANFALLESQIAATSDCPAGYTKGGATETWQANAIVCTSMATSDQMVKVGVGPSAFWIDRYEASVWTAPSGGTEITGATDTAYGTAGVPKNGQTTTPLFALSLPGMPPSTTMTWFQAVEFCAASGKRLPRGDEWLRAARGTYDPGATPTATECNTSGTALRNTNLALATTNQQGSCASDWGAEDMIGNVWEWTSDWYAGLNSTATDNVSGTWPNPANSDYGGDGTWNINSYAYADESTWTAHEPAAALRGGSFSSAALAGTFALDVRNAPSAWDPHFGFRCVVSR